MLSLCQQERQKEKDGVLGMDKEDKRNEWQSLDSLNQDGGTTDGGRAKSGMMLEEQNGEGEQVEAKTEKGVLTTEHNRKALEGFDRALSRFGARGKGGELLEGQGRGRGGGGKRGGRGRGRGRGGMQKQREPFSMVRRGEGLIGDRGLKFD